jgi:hypothetical protein
VDSSALEAYLADYGVTSSDERQAGGVEDGPASIGGATQSDQHNASPCVDAVVSSANTQPVASQAPVSAIGLENGDPHQLESHTFSLDVLTAVDTFLQSLRPTPADASTNTHQASITQPIEPSFNFGDQSTAPQEPTSSNRGALQRRRASGGKHLRYVIADSADDGSSSDSSDASTVDRRQHSSDAWDSMWRAVCAITALLLLGSHPHWSVANLLQQRISRCL